MDHWLAMNDSCCGNHVMCNYYKATLVWGAIRGTHVLTGPSVDHRLRVREARVVSCCWLAEKLAVVC